MQTYLCTCMPGCRHDILGELCSLRPALLKNMKSLREYLPGLQEKYPKFCFEE